MEILGTLRVYAETRNLRFLLIGGHAINAYGISRHTGDLDIVVSKTEKEIWLELMRMLGYRTQQNQDAFPRHTPPQIAAWPIDFMHVDLFTFDQLYAEGRLINIGGQQVKVVSPNHLVAMKLHALKQDLAHRRAKDLGDIIALLSQGIATITEQELRTLTKKFKVEQLQDELVTYLPGRN